MNAFDERKKAADEIERITAKIERLNRTSAVVGVAWWGFFIAFMVSILDPSLESLPPAVGAFCGVVSFRWWTKSALAKISINAFNLRATDGTAIPPAALDA